MSMLATRQRAVNKRARRLALLDPVVHMPNLRALSRDLAKNPWSALCLLRIPELEILGRNYGVLLRIQYKQQLAQWVNGTLQPNEQVYHLTGYDWRCGSTRNRTSSGLTPWTSISSSSALSGTACRCSRRWA
jgi:GGDEF domain-containing protein